MALSIRVSADDYERLYPRTQQFPRKLKRQLRTQLRDAARPAVRDAQAAALALRLPAVRPARRPHPRRSTGLRRGISNNIKLILRDQGAGVEYRIVATHRMAEPTNASSFRHPVYGNRDVWVAQRSQLWFTHAINRHKPAMREAAGAALREAVDEL